MNRTLTQSLHLLFVAAIAIAAVTIYATQSAGESLSTVLLVVGLAEALFTLVIMGSDRVYVTLRMAFRNGYAPPLWATTSCYLVTFIFLSAAGDYVTSIVWLLVGTFETGLRREAERPRRPLYGGPRGG